MCSSIRTRSTPNMARGWKSEEARMNWLVLFATHLWVFVAGVHFAEWSAREDHATMRAAGQWLRSWFI